MDNTTLYVIGAIVIIAAIYFSKKKSSSAPADVSESLPAGKAEQENSSGTVEK